MDKQTIPILHDMVHRRTIFCIFIFAIFLCSFSLYLSIYPGVLQNFGTFIAIAFLWLLMFGIIAILVLKLWCQRSEIGTRLAFHRLISIGLLMICCLGLLKFYVPRRIAFFLSRPAFENWLTEHRVKTHKFPSYKSQSIDTKLGFYHVDKYALYRRGGDYFQVHSHGDGLGPDTISYGFVYRPNLDSSPFGDANYGIYQLGDGWYWFHASNDW